eukprot:Clim_evm95s153 gene=Clim_evmTU95s153
MIGSQMPRPGSKRPVATWGNLDVEPLDGAFIGPITALHWISSSETDPGQGFTLGPLLCVGIGPFIRIFDGKSGIKVLERQIHGLERIHKIRSFVVHGDDGRAEYLLCQCVTEVVVLPVKSERTVTVTQHKAYRVGDRILDVRLARTDQYDGSIIMDTITAHNKVIRVPVHVSDDSICFGSSVTHEGQYCSILYAAAFQPDDQPTVAIGTVFKEIFLWSFEEGKYSTPVFLKGHEGAIFTLSFNPHQHSLLASGSDDRTVRLWNLQDITENETLVPYAVLRGHHGRVWNVSWHAATVVELLSTGEDGRAILWDASNSKEVTRVAERVGLAGNSIWTSTVIPTAECTNDTGGNDVLLGHDNGEIKVWQTASAVGIDESHPEIEVVIDDSKASVSRIQAFGGSSSFACVFYDDGRISVGSMAHGPDEFMAHAISSHSEFLRRCLVSKGTADGQCILCATFAGVILRIDQAANIEEFAGLNIANVSVMEPLSPSMLLICDSQGQHTLWTCDVNNPTSTVPGMIFQWETSVDEMITSAAFDAERNLVVTGMRNGFVRAFQISADTTGVVESTVTTASVHSKRGIASIYVTDSGHYLSCGMMDGAICLFAVKENTNADESTTWVIERIEIFKMTKVARNANLIACLLPLGNSSVHDRTNKQLGIRDDFVVIVGCFFNKSFNLYNLQDKKLMLSVPCGGHHRSWTSSYYQTESGTLRYWFGYIRDSKLNIAIAQNLDHTKSHWRLIERHFPPSHTRESRALCLRKLDDTTLCGISGGDAGYAMVHHWDASVNRNPRSRREPPMNVHILERHKGTITSLAVTGQDQQIWMYSAGAKEEIRSWEGQVLEGRHRRLRFLFRSGLPQHLVKSVGDSLGQNDEARYMAITTSPQNPLVFLAGSSNMHLFRVEIDAESRHHNVIWSYKAGRCILSMQWITRTEGSPEEIVLVGLTNGEVQRMDPATGTPRSKFRPHQSGVNAIAVVEHAKDSWLVASGGDDNAIALTEVYADDARKVDFFVEEAAHSSMVTCIKWLPRRKNKRDPLMFMSLSIDQRLNIWTVDETVLSFSLTASTIIHVADPQDMDFFSNVPIDVPVEKEAEGARKDTDDIAQDITVGVVGIGLCFLRLRTWAPTEPATLRRGRGSNVSITLAPAAS